MDQYDYLSRDQLVALVHALGGGGTAASGSKEGAEGLPEFGERAMRDFERSSSPMRIFDRKTLRYLAVNEAAVRFYGYSRDEFLALTIRDTRHPDEHAAQFASLERAVNYFSHGASRRQIKKSGEVAVVELVSQDVLFNGREARLSLTIDITGRLRMQELLWKRQQEFESLAENLPDLVARYDRERRFLYANSAIERAVGRARAGIVGRTQREIGLPQELIAIYDDSLAGVFATGEPHKVEFRLTLASGEKQFEAYHVPEMDATGAIGSVLCVARDITEHKRVEDELKGQQRVLDAVIDSSGATGLLTSVSDRGTRAPLARRPTKFSCRSRPISSCSRTGGCSNPGGWRKFLSSGLSIRSRGQFASSICARSRSTTRTASPGW
jgi:PAS domain S-box-containing protein